MNLGEEDPGSEQHIELEISSKEITEVVQYEPCRGTVQG